MEFEMSERPKKKPRHSEFALVNFETYEEYLDSIYSDLDKCYLQDRWMCRKIAQFGYRRDGVTYTKKQFWKIREQVLKYLTPVGLYTKASEGFRFGDPVQNALCLRERANRLGLLCTIIFINYTDLRGREISGYIDFAHSLIKKNWKKFFLQNVLIYPDEKDLGYYDWQKQKTIINDSLYYKTLMSPIHGLVFQHKFDRMMIIPDPYAKSPGPQTQRTRIWTKLYNTCIVLDHVLRSRK